jgi:DNA polymerase-3 subunit alpha
LIKSELIGIANEDDLAGETIQQAKFWKVRCEIQVFTPVEYYYAGHYELRTSNHRKDSDLYVTQFDNSVAESAGLLKMDFLGLKPNADKRYCKAGKISYWDSVRSDAFPIDDVKHIIPAW